MQASQYLSIGYKEVINDFEISSGLHNINSVFIIDRVSGLIGLPVETDTTEAPPQGGVSVFLAFQILVSCFNETLFFFNVVIERK